ncbi:hypothetical protein PV10_00018 [Exophiala mesophila]|uniref:Uncharacterized protein n=1 Tax=Exophiala mesophila TaxID=212818 RepID=A0A0D1ZQ84_EXOME|nr:uncharacterized protein PV10_00018 [Exophiala mesophila]KIV96114.1 hypothetical protein PV10_00018 [Exophiala mesophila]
MHQSTQPQHLTLGGRILPLHVISQGEMQASPSKARAHALETHSWSLVTSWLGETYHPRPVPAFERNAATLNALQILMTECLTANELHHLIFESRSEQLIMAETHGTTGDEHPLHGKSDLVAILDDSLSQSAQSALDSMSRSKVLLGGKSSSCHSSRFIGALEVDMVGLSRRIFDLEAQTQQVEDLISNLVDQDSHVDGMINGYGIYAKENSPGIDTDDLVPEHPSLHSQILQHQREIKQLSLKADEYRNRLASLSNVQPLRSKSGDVTVADVASGMEALDRKRKQMLQFQETIASFHGLPPDVHSSRQEVKRVLGELNRLQTKRDELFAKLIE